MLLIFKRIFRTAWQGIRRNSWLAVANISIMVLSVALFSSAFLLNFSINSLIKSIKEKVDISIYFKADTPEEDILRIRDEILGMPEIMKIDYISKNEALEKFLERRAENKISKILEELGINPLSASLNIKVREIEDYDEVINYIKSSLFYDKLISIDLARNQQIIARVNTLVRGLKIISFMAVIILASISIIVSFNTIRMAIYSLREEIEIMKLVGASNWFVRGPFLVEGAIQGIIASLITTFLIIPLVLWLGPKIDIFAPGLNIYSYFLGNFWLIFGWQTLFAVCLGIVSSFIAINKYLKV